MVLSELGQRLSSSLSSLRNRLIIDDKALDDALREIGNSLVASDVSAKIVFQLKKNIKDSIDLPNLPSGLNKFNVVQKAIFDEICRMLTSKKESYRPKKGKSNIIMFVGLQGAGKTTSICKVAHYYKKHGWNPSLICGDTFRAGAFAQMAQNAAKIKVPFFGNEDESDPVKTVVEGVELFKKEGCNIILVDTSGRNKQESDLFQEMKQMEEAINPNLITFIMDGSIGQAASDQALAFSSNVKLGSVIITKLDGNSKGGGALSAVAATNCPITFIGTGEHMNELEPFDVEIFVSKLLGIPNPKGMKRVLEDLIPKNKEMIPKGKLTYRDIQNQLQNFLEMGSIGSFMQMIPGLSNLPGMDNNLGNERIKTMITVMDGMSRAELDSDKPIKNSTQIQRLARGCGKRVEEISQILQQLGMMISMQPSKPGKSNAVDMAKMMKMIPPQMLNQMGGQLGLNKMLKQFGNESLPKLGRK